MRFLIKYILQINTKEIVRALSYCPLLYKKTPYAKRSFFIEIITRKTPTISIFETHQTYSKDHQHVSPQLAYMIGLQ